MTGHCYATFIKIVKVWPSFSRAISVVDGNINGDESSENGDTLQLFIFDFRYTEYRTAKLYAYQI